MPSPEPYPGLCGARVKQGEGYCQRFPINGTGRCRLHGGASTGAPKGNRNAVGNPGGGAPELNANAAKHHGWSDPEKHYQRLDAEGRETVGFFEEMYADQFRRVHGVEPTDADPAALGIADALDLDADEEITDRIHRLAVFRHQRNSAEAEGWGNMSVEREVGFEGPEGETQTFTNTVLNPAIDAGFQLGGRIRASERDLGIAPDALARSRQ